MQFQESSSYKYGWKWQGSATKYTVNNIAAAIYDDDDVHCGATSSNLSNSTIFWKDFKQNCDYFQGDLFYRMK